MWANEGLEAQIMTTPLWRVLSIMVNCPVLIQSITRHRPSSCHWCQRLKKELQQTVPVPSEFDTSEYRPFFFFLMTGGLPSSPAHRQYNVNRYTRMGSEYPTLLTFVVGEFILPQLLYAVSLRSRSRWTALATKLSCALFLLYSTSNSRLIILD